MNSYQDNILIHSKRLFGSGKLPLDKHKNKHVDYRGIKQLISDTPPINDKSFKVYVNRLSNLWRDVFDTDISPSNLNMILEKDKVTEYLAKLDTTKKTNLLSSIMAIFKRLKDFDQAELETYSALLKTSSEERKNDLHKNKINSDEKELYDGVKWADLQTIVKNIDPNNGQLARTDKALLGLYLLAPAPRRLMDYSMLIVKKLKTPLKAKIAPDDKNNYLLTTLNDIPKKVILNTYKTSGIYGRYTFEPNKELQSALKPLVEVRKDGDHLFLQKNGTPYSVNSFTTLVKGASQRRLGKPFTVNNFRHLFSNLLWSENRPLSELKEKSLDMGHDILTSLEYRKIE